MFLSKPADAQLSLTIGSGTATGNYHPIYTYYGYNYTQQIFLASDLVAAGATAGLGSYISSISFNPTSYMSDYSTKCKDWVVYLGGSSKTSFSGTTDWIPLSSLTKVFDGVTTISATGWYKITFSTPYYWDGTSNLVVAVDENTAGYTSSGGMTWQATTRSSNRAIYYYNDGTNPDPASPPTANNITTVTSDIKIDYLPAVACSGSVTGGSAVASATTICAGGSVGLNATGTTAATGLTYVWDSSATGTGGWAPVSTPTTSPAFTFTPPGGRTLYYRMRITCTATAATATSTTVSVSVGNPILPPYTEDFEGAIVGTNIPCASFTGGWGDGSYWYIRNTAYSAATNHTTGGSKYLLAGYNMYSSQEYWFTPGIKLLSGKTYRFSYWYVNDGYAYYNPGTGATIGTDQTKATQVAIGPYINSTSTSYKQYVTDFTVPADNIYFIGIRMLSTGSYGWGFDDLNLLELPPCTAATPATFKAGGKTSATPNVICSTPGTTTLSISGTPAFSGLGFSWEVATGTPSTFSAAGITTATGTYSIPSGGNYYFRCKVTCTATGVSVYSDTVKVTTTPILPPYTEDFESAVGGGVNLPCAGYSGSFSSGSTSAWDIRTSPYDATYSPGIINHTPGGSKYLFGGYYMGSVASSVPRYWFTPGLALTAAKAYNFSFWVSNNGYYPTSYPTSAIEVGVRAGLSQTDVAMTIAAGTDTVITPNAVSTATYNQVKRGFIAPTTGTYYVGIRFNCTSSGYPGIAFDDIGLDMLPSCAAKPAAGIAKSIPAVVCGSGSTSLSLSGTSVASDLTFQWQKSPNGLPGTFVDIAGATTPGYTTPVISADTYYRCVVVCPLITAPRADTSTVIRVKVTPLIPPYFEDFETGTAGVNMPCASAAGGSTVWSAGSLQYWDLREGPYSSYPAITNHTPGGKKYLYSGYYNGTYSGPTSAADNYFWFTPGLALTGGKSYKCSFWFSSNGSSSTPPGFKLGIYAGTVQTAAGMTIRAGGLDTSVNVISGGYRQIVRSFTAPTTGTYYVGIKTVHVGYNYPGVPLDDIGIDQNPSCTGKPVAGVADGTPGLICSTGTSRLRLSGTTAASDLTYQWLESTAGATGPWSAVAGGTGATASDYTTATLSAGRWYRCVVKCSVSGLTDTSTVVAISVGAITPPYRETFESILPGTNPPCAFYNSTFGTATSTTNWTTKGFPYSGYGMIYDNHTPGGTNYLWAGYYFGYASGVPNGGFWFTPAIKLVKDTSYEFSFWYQGPAYYYYHSAAELGMFYGTAQTEAAMTNTIRAGFVDKSDSYRKLIGRFKSVGTGNYYLAIKVKHTYSAYTYYGTAIDDIGLDQLPPCNGMPTAGVIYSLPDMLCSAGTVALDMHYHTVPKASGLSYRWQWTNTDPTSGPFIPAGSGASLSAPSYTSPSISTTTWFRCIVKCDYTGDSTFSSPIKVDVGIVTPPYLQTFEYVNQGVNAPCASNTSTFSPSSWSYWGTYRVPLGSSYAAIYNHTPGGTAYLMAGGSLTAGEYWFTPRIQLTGGKLYRFSFWYNGTGYAGGKTNVGAYYGTTNTAAGMTFPIGTDLIDVNEMDYKQLSRTFTPATTGAYYLGIKIAHTVYVYPGMAIDDIGVQEVPPCSAPVVAGNISSTPAHVCGLGSSAQLDLKGSTLATGLSYKWLSSTSETGPYTAIGTSTSLPFTTPPLTDNTWFRAIITCTATGATDTSAPFRLGAGGFDLPYVEDFETTGVGQQPLCSDATTWGTSYTNGWYVYSGTYTGSYGNHTPGGKKHLVGGYLLGYSTSTPIYPIVTDDNYWFTPGFKFRGGYKYNLSFWYVGSSSSSYNHRLGVYYGGSQTVGAMTNTIIPFKKVSNTGYERYDTSFNIASTGVYYLGFKKSSGTINVYNYAGIAFDDINLNYAPCDGMPQAGGIKSALTSGMSLCKGTTVVLLDTNATIGMVPGIKYQWQRKGIGSGAPSNWQPVVGATDTMLKGDTLVGYQYRMAVVCANTGDSAFTAAFQIPETPPHPAVTISPSTSPVMYCLGDTVAFTATSFTGAVYDWMLDSATIPGWKFSDLGATEPGTYMVKVSSALSPCPAYSNKVKLQANDPGYKVTITVPSDSILCDGEAITLTAIASKPGVSFQWRRNNVPIPGAVSNTYTVRTDGSYRVVAFDGISSCPAVSRNIHFSVKPNPPAVVSVPGGTLTACAETGVRLDANIGGFSYQWNRSGSPVFGWVDSSVLVKNSGVYNVKVRSADGCVSVSHDVTVSILPSPVPVIKRTDLMLETVLSYSFYQWIRNSADIYMANSRSYLMSKHGLYQVRVTDFNGCLGLSTPIAVFDDDVRLDVDNVSGNSNEIKVYPNPTSAKVNIECPVGFKLTIKDISGKTILERTDAKEVDLSRYADGVYLFMISDKEGTNILKQQRVNKVSAKQ